MSPELTPHLLVDFSKFRLCIHKKTIVALGNPEYILLMVNPKEKTIGIIRGTQKDNGAHRIINKRKKDNRCYEIYSRSFVRKLIEVCPEFREKNSYRLNGEIITGKSIARYYMENAEEIRINKEDDAGAE